jgi:hypothetical protein
MEFLIDYRPLWNSNGTVRGSSRCIGHLPPCPASAGLFFEPLLLDQADVAAVSRQVHLALFYDARLDIGAMD